MPLDDNNLSAGDWLFGKLLRMGANWKTTLGGILGELFWFLTLLATAPYSLPHQITDIIPPKAKAWFFSVCSTAALVVRVWTWWNTKSKDVTGGNTQQTLTGKIADPGTQILVDATLKATVASGEEVSPEQKQIAANLPNKP